MAATKTQGNQSGEKLLAIFEYLIKAQEPRKLQEISQDLGMNASTTLRFLATLVNCGYVKQNDETARYEPTLKVCALANNINTEDLLRRTAKPFMNEISKYIGESVCLGVRVEDKVVYTEVIKVKNQSLMAVQAVGNAAEMYCNGIGKLFLAHFSEEKLNAYIVNHDFEKYTDYTITKTSDLKKELDAIRTRGFAYDNQEREVGARCLAFPIYDANGDMVGGISVTGPYSRLTDEHVEGKIDEIKRIVNELSKSLGCSNLS
ncbi:MAG: IclR family transcriptional regulator [Lachnospiraceae bacterium]|nr:IclR family transcriptional regulator [Lachnospiraceae bacterium]